MQPAAAIIPPASSPDNPYPAYRYLQEHAPVHQTATGHWLITRYADANQLLQDARCAHWGQDETAFPHLSAVERALATTLYALAPDGGRPYRKQLMHELAARSLRLEEVPMHTLATSLLRQLHGRAEVDFIRDFAHPFTFGTISRFIGIPAEQQAAFSELVAAMGGSYLACADPATGQATPQGRAFTQQLRTLIAAKQQAPDDSICAALLASSQAEADPESFVLAMLILLFYAGHQNMMNFLGNALLALHEQPAVQQQVRQHPALLSSNVDELIRYDSPLQFIMLIAREALVVGGTLIPAGSQLLIGVGAANRDPAAFAQPDQLVLGRQPRHLGFGAGAFRCIGARLAQLQGSVGLRAWFEQVASYHPLPGQTRWHTQPFVQRGPAALPLQVTWHD